MLHTLVLIRHAKSSWEDASWSDFDRPLNKRGLRDAPVMAQKLKQTGLEPDLVVSSPANRAFTTACFHAEAYGIAKEQVNIQERIYEAGISELLDIVQNLPENAGTVYLFGHNNGISMFAGYLTGEMLLLPTQGTVVIAFDTPWKDVTMDSGTLIRHMFPKQFAELQ